MAFARQRPGTARGVIFISLEDETGIANLIIFPGLYEQKPLLVTRSRFLLAEGILQNQEGVIHILASDLMPLSDGELATTSHDFH